ncbi:MAG: proline racemase family protein [candidate division Zixibacteria bacterium]
MSTFPIQFSDWKPPDEWVKIKTVDAHTEGEPLRVIIAGYPELDGQTILERRRHALEKYDYLRTALMWEPRGHADMYGCIITPAVSPEADFGILFLHNEGYSSMCGHGIIAIAKVVLETGLMEIREPETVIRIDTPSGMVTSYAKIKNGNVESVRFHNVASYADTFDAEVEVPELGRVRYDLAFGGAYYAYVQAQDVGLTCLPQDHYELIRKGMMIKRAVMKSHRIEHPFEHDLNFLYGTIFIGPPEDNSSDSRNVCIFAEGEVDRSPTGTGVSGLMAIHYARGEIGLNEPYVIESIIGSKFTGRIIKETVFGPHKAVIPEVEGRAYITGVHEFVIDPDDPLKHGFILR